MTTRVGPMVAAMARARGVSTTELAAEIGMHRNRLADKIAGRRDWREREIQAAADYFGVEPGHLFENPLELLGIGSIAHPRIAAGPRPAAESDSSPSKFGCSYVRAGQRTRTRRCATVSGRVCSSPIWVIRS